MRSAPTSPAKRGHIPCETRCWPLQFAGRIQRSSAVPSVRTLNSEPELVDLFCRVTSGDGGGVGPLGRLQRTTVVRKLQRELRMLKGRCIAVLGLAFKPGTDDLRDAPALAIIRGLLASGSVVSAYDPVVKRLPEELAAVRLATDVYDAVRRADAVVLTTEWPEFRDIDADTLRQVMKGDLLIDGRNFLPEAAFAGSGLRIVGFGW